MHLNHKVLGAALALLLCSITGCKMADNTRVKLTTSHGELIIRLEDDKAPITVANFLSYVDRQDYNNTIFHRVIKSFMVQGGGFYQGLTMAAARAPIRNEADNGLRNVRGSIAMARTSDIDSASRQFFINTVNNAFLDNQPGCTREATAASGCSFGYAVFGQVESGMDTVDRIEAVATATKGGHQNVPVDPVILLKAERL